MSPENQVMLSALLEYGGMVLAILGAELVSRKMHLSPYGWLCWMLANLLTIGFAALHGHWGLALTQLWFFKTSFTGVRNFLLPMLAERRRSR